MRASLCSFLVACMLGVAQALSATGSSLLVVLDDASDKAQYSKFWDDLTGRGYDLTFESPKSDPQLFKHGERQFSHLLILPTRLKALGPALTPQILLDFVKNDGNILLALSSDVPTPSTLNSLLLELDIHLPTQRDSLVVDHFNYDTVAASEKHDVLVLPQPTSKKASVKSYFGGDGFLAVPKAVGQSLGGSSPLLATILGAPTTAYSYSPREESEVMEDLFATGSQLSLVTAFQARNSARFTVLGAAEMLENTWFDASVKKVGSDKKVKTANQAFAKAVSAWAFQELGVLRVGRLQHYLNEGRGTQKLNDSSVAVADVNPKIYKINNEVTYTIELSEWSGNGWTPYQPPTSDEVQLEVTMLSPYHRINLAAISSSSEATVFGTSFKLPDQHGIFNFRFTYKRPFLTNVDEKRTVTVRHNAHDEWPRSYVISGAYPWIAGIWVTIAGWLLFVFVWLFSAPKDAARAAKKTQ